MHFYKYQGTGNDFIMFDNREAKIEITKKQVARLCDRRFGIGADGLILLNAHADYDFEMVYFNADGSQSMCGNGGRCTVKFASDRGIIKAGYRFLAIDGGHEARIETNGKVALKMNDVPGVRRHNGRYILNTGSPHYVEMVEGDLMSLDVVKKGRAIRYSDEYKQEGINVNFVQQTDEPDKVIVRTYERGVEDETFSCGTGVTAAALVNYHNEAGYNYVCVQTKGGMLNVEFDKTENGFKNIWLIGPAEKVFEGEVEV